MVKIGIVDIGVGNIGSVENICSHFSNHIEIISSDWKKFDDLDLLILPGVGHFDSVIKALDFAGLRDPLIKYLNSNKFFLGICVGYQLLFESSEEGILQGLGFLKGNLKKFDSEIIRVPHMGWNEVFATNFIFELKGDFYFTHSYYVPDTYNYKSKLNCNYNESFLAGVCVKNVIGLQFHPEKSGRNGFNFFKELIKAVDEKKNYPNVTNS